MTATCENIKAIETVYKGYRFRSRLEARWAVFFDALGVEWEYEKEGFEFEGIRYLPDFYLPQNKAWVEIKPEDPDHDVLYKCHRLSVNLDSPVVLICGHPNSEHTDYAANNFDEYICKNKMHVFYGEAWNMELPPFRISDWRFDHMWALDLHKMLCDEGYNTKVPAEMFQNAETYVKALVDCDRLFYFDRHGVEHPYYKYGRKHNGVISSAKAGRINFCTWDICVCRDAHIALTKARQARFEYGETPQI